MRCVICDTSDNGLSDYRPDGRFHAHRFHELPGGPVCDECYEYVGETSSDFYDQDLEQEENDDAFDYTDTDQ